MIGTEGPNDATEAVAFAQQDLLNDLAEIVVRHLERKAWNYSRLAEAMRKQVPAITRVVHSTQNCTFKTAAEFIVALGLSRKVRLVDLELYEKDRKEAHDAAQAAVQVSTSLKFPIKEVRRGKIKEGSSGGYAPPNTFGISGASSYAATAA